jgi:uncharacterized protein with NRDE domain
MCTVTWLSEPDSYTVFFNRDELKTRSRALPPAVKTQNGVRYIAPVDVDGGGTWLGVNEFGITCGLLNNYHVHRHSFRSRQPRRGTTASQLSRGLLVTSLLDSPSLTKALAKLNATSVSAFRPFLLTFFAPNAPVVLCNWDGETLRIQPEQVELPISSSSFDTRNVVQNRRHEFAHLHAGNHRLDAALLEAYHASHSENGGAYSVCMHRSDAETVSFSRIRVAPGQIEFHYTSGAPCATKARVNVILKCSSK